MSQPVAVSETRSSRARCARLRSSGLWMIGAEWVPVDADPSEMGTHSLRPMWGASPRAVKPSPKLAFGAKLRQIHYSTCAKGKTLRKQRR
jgi:hypothetical protein